MKNNQPKFLTKAELRAAAMRELNVSENSFDFAWIAAIEEADPEKTTRVLTIMLSDEY